MSRRILIVEDDLEIRKNLSTILEMNGYDVIGAGNGSLGLQLALQYLPDLIISDVMMPELDGFEMLNELRKHEETLGIPFLFLTARIEKKDIREGMNLGADDFITKPFDMDDLLDAVNARIQKSEARKEHYSKKMNDLRFNISRSLPHEVRTPLSVILGYSEILQRSWRSLSDDDINDMLLNVHSSAKRLHRVFEKYLYYANLELISSNETEKAKLQDKVTPSARVVVSDVCRRYSDEYSREADIRSTLADASIKMSEDYFNLLIEELIDNAMKYSEIGSEIQLNSTIKAGVYCLSITNYGRGMTPEQIAGIGAYVQYDRLIHEQQGLGLGLAISKKIVDLHRGLFKMESEIEYFTTVSIELPCIIEDEERD